MDVIKKREVEAVHETNRTQQKTIFVQKKLTPYSTMKLKSKLPGAEIPDYPNSITSELILARMIDGLAFRYHWVTEGLRPKDLAYLPGNNGRSSAETLDHLYSLSKTIINSVHGRSTISSSEKEKHTFEEQRIKTLSNFESAGSFLRSKTTNINSVKINFERDKKSVTFPIWNLINGPISDAIYHCGQIVSFRRSSGNPIPPNVNVFKGTKTE